MAVTRVEVLEFLACNKPTRISAAKVVPEFLEMLQEYLDLNNPDMATILGASTDEIKRKRKIAQDRGILVRRDDGVLVISKNYIEEEDFLGKSIEEKIDYIDRKLDMDIVGTEPLDADKKKAMKERRADLTKDRAAEISEGNNVALKLIEFFRNTAIPAIRTAFGVVFKNLKSEIAYGTVTAIFEEVEGRNILPREDFDRIKDEVTKKAMAIAEQQSKDFDIADVFHDTWEKNQTIKDSIDRYMERTGQLRLVGGGVGKLEDTKVGGAQYKQKAREEARAEEARKKVF